jgi:hypothetical protein
MPVKKNSLFPLQYDEVSLVDSGANQHADILIMKRENPVTKIAVPDTKKTDSKKKRKPESDPCGDTTNSTGAKETDPSKKSTRAKNYKEDRHKRKEDGQFSQTDKKSKEKYGKDGTTKAKQDAECKSKGGKPKKGTSGATLQKSFSFITAVTDARLRGILERKAG